jgi:hypothetical protein
MLRLITLNERNIGHIRALSKLYLTTSTFVLNDDPRQRERARHQRAPNPDSIGDGHWIKALRLSRQPGTRRWRTLGPANS